MRAILMILYAFYMPSHTHAIHNSKAILKYIYVAE